MKTAVFLLRVDTVTNKAEGEVYLVEKSGIINCNVWVSPKLTDYQVIIASGQKAIDEVYKQYDSYHIIRYA